VTTTAHIRDRFELGGIDVAIVTRDQTPSVRVWDSAFPAYRALTENDPTEAPQAERLVLRTDEARALYESLAEHYGHGTNDTRALRRDHDAERDRVDKLTDAIIAIARRTTGGS
jgi:hypothetical protein